MTQEVAVLHEDDALECPWCSNFNSYEIAFLGVLGHLTHFRCRYCGGGFHQELQEAK